MKYWGQAERAETESAGIGVLLSNLGTPDAPTSPALRRYLREFLSDPRVIELPRWLWWLVLNLFVLPTRPRKSAALYRKVWTEEGSPLLVNTERLAVALETALRGPQRGPAALAERIPVRVGMRYGNPSIRAALRALNGLGCRRIVVLPLYPQYSAVTTGSTIDGTTAELREWRSVPELRTVGWYYNDPAYIAALADSVRELWRRDGEPERLLFSFHGIPERYARAGDPYGEHCRRTAALVAERLALPAERWVLAFQSLFGREEWLKPYSEATIRGLAQAGVRRLDVVCPGFAADCLETIEEMDEQNREVFLKAGGEQYRYVPALNDRPDHVAMLAALVRRSIAGWSTPNQELIDLRQELPLPARVEQR